MKPRTLDTGIANGNAQSSCTPKANKTVNSDDIKWMQIAFLINNWMNKWRENEGKSQRKIERWTFRLTKSTLLCRRIDFCFFCVDVRLFYIKFFCRWQEERVSMAERSEHRTTWATKRFKCNEKSFHGSNMPSVVYSNALSMQPLKQQRHTTKTAKKSEENFSETE